MKVLDKGILELKNFSASDFSVVAAARVSNGVEFGEASKGTEADQKLINYLVKHKHGTPFEHNLFTFYVKIPLFARSEWHRHRIGWSYNEISGRYVEFKPEFYIPEHWRVSATSNKQGSVFPDNAEEFDQDCYQIFIDSIYPSYDMYRALLAKGVAKEMARMVLPQNMYTEFYASCNARSLMHFINLRNSETAQWEIRQYALAMEEMFKETMPMTYQAFLENERISP